jgi:DEAD/DEAH box helicase domain-containing protein
VPGGIGLAERLWERHDELVTAAFDLIASCGCEAGCPSCTGPRLEPGVDARALALRLLEELGAPGGSMVAAAMPAISAIG